MLRLRGNLPFAEAVIFLLGAVAKGMTEPTYAKGCTTFKLGALNRCIVVAIIWGCLLSGHALEGKDRVKKSYTLFGTLPLFRYR